MGYLLLTVTAIVLATGRGAWAADPTIAECLSASEKSLSLQNQHRLRAARAELVSCSSASCPTDIREECTRRVGEIKLAIPTVVFEARDASGKDLFDVRITMDGETLSERLDGTAISVDPGVHLFGFETQGHSKVETKVLVREGEKERREHISFDTPGIETATSGPVPATGSSSPAADLTTASGPSGASPGSTAWTPRRKVGVALGATALAGLTTGVIFNFVYDSRAKDFNAAGCYTALPNDGPAGCQAKHDAARSAEYVFIAGYASAVILGGLGAYALFVDPSPSSDTRGAGGKVAGFNFRCLPTGGTAVACGGTF
jgi:hypothetical protein